MEYGTDKIEMHVGAVQAGERAVIVDDLIATGGTLNAAIRLLGMIHYVFVHVHVRFCFPFVRDLKLAIVTRL